MSEKIWFLHYNFTQHGPFTSSEIAAMLREATIAAKTFAWRKGMRDWSRILDTPELLLELGSAVHGAEPETKEGTKTNTRTRTRKISKTKAKAKAKIKEPDPATETSVSEMEITPEVETQASRDGRGSPRKPLVAQIIFTDQSKVSVGLCKDISENGLWVLTDAIPGAVGTPLNVNISPADSKLPPFKAVGRIVRVDARGYALKFEKLGEKERSILAEFLKKS